MEPSFQKQLLYAIMSGKSIFCPLFTHVEFANDFDFNLSLCFGLTNVRCQMGLAQNNKDKYLNVFGKHSIISSLKDQNINSCCLMFRQDTELKHFAKLTRNWLTRKKTSTFFFGRYSSQIRVLWKTRGVS